MQGPPNQSNISSRWGIRNRYRIVILLMARLSTHMRQLSSFFGIKKSRYRAWTHALS